MTNIKFTFSYQILNKNIKIKICIKQTILYLTFVNSLVRYKNPKQIVSRVLIDYNLRWTQFCLISKAEKIDMYILNLEAFKK
ncbi:hypothetical protein BpHYR1_043403 [Brachionus plicatilis]|uniref:Uncharacterized protein n=1 Tax=Brachionus plicatilis TaxID=10195 RepID=A0A3M7RKZ5_BRAPC|nr:hypothetical protein BpHYR1_043403 [Brachionus plicatilis]